MIKKCAICLRGKCKDTNINSKSNYKERIDYKLCINRIFLNIINNNLDYTFDFYLHGWIDDINLINEIIKDYKPVKYILELQKDFKNDYININNYSLILKERYKHLHKNKNYDNIYYNNYFQNIFSYAYSISKVIELINDIDYHYIINLRYDLYLIEKINLNDLNNDLVYVDYVGKSQSPLFIGDFLYISNKNNTLFLKNFYNFMKNNIFNNIEYKNWTDNIIKNKNKEGRYDHGIYSNQMIYAYFITKNGIPYNNIVNKYNCKIIKKIIY